MPYYLAHLSLQELTPPSYKMLISRPFTFIIGPDKVLIVVHEAILAKQSLILITLIQGEIVKSVTSEARWITVDKGTFI
jgi:hypothetical protein